LFLLSVIHWYFTFHQNAGFCPERLVKPSKKSKKKCIADSKTSSYTVKGIKNKKYDKMYNVELWIPK